MKIDDSKNYVILANDINESLKNFVNIPVIGSNLSFDELMQKLDLFPSKQVVFNETWYNLKEKEIKEVIDFLDKQNVKYINVTANVEETLYADEIVVFDKDKKVLEGPRDEVLKEEKILKKIGFGLPFVVDLSIQLNYYDIFDKVYYDMDFLVGELWN